MSSDWPVLLLVGLPIVVAVVLAVVEVIGRPDLGAGRTAIWVVALIVLPVVAVATYVIVRPVRGPRNDSQDGAVSPTSERLVEAAERRQRGELDDDGFRAVVDTIRR